jgi:hypothetical protein
MTCLVHYRQLLHKQQQQQHTHYSNKKMITTGIGLVIAIVIFLYFQNKRLLSKELDKFIEEYYDDFITHQDRIAKFLYGIVGNANHETAVKAYIDGGLKVSKSERRVEFHEQLPPLRESRLFMCAFWTRFFVMLDGFALVSHDNRTFPCPHVLKTFLGIAEAYDKIYAAYVDSRDETVDVQLVRNRLFKHLLK